MDVLFVRHSTICHQSRQPLSLSQGNRHRLDKISLPVFVFVYFKGKTVFMRERKHSYSFGY
jgi:hypothetical protein